MTDKPTPTDEVIDAVTLEVLGYAALDKDTNETARLIARAVLAKWGAPQPVAREPLSAREIELLDGMIDAQLDHAKRCDLIQNRLMAEKQKGWDMERVTLLRKLKASRGGQQP